MKIDNQKMGIPSDLKNLEKDLAATLKECSKNEDVTANRKQVVQEITGRIIEIHRKTRNEVRD